MAYEIPQQIEYKEKIIFGLTFRQIAYAAFFLVIAAISYKSGLAFAAKWGIIITSIIAGAGFMFLDLDQKLKDWKYYLSFRKAYLLDKRMQDFIGLEKIEDNYAYISQNKKRYRIAIIKIKPINFSIKNCKEKDSLIKSFQKFLNSLDFPVQILMTTDSLNLDSYLNQMESRIESAKNTTYDTLFKGYKEFITEKIKDADRMDRYFYIIIPEKNNIEAQINSAREMLDCIGLKNEILDNKEIELCFARFFNNMLEDEDKSKSAKEKLSKDNILQYSIQPKFLRNRTGYFQINNSANRIIAASGYPRTVEAGFLDRIITSKGDFDISIHIEPFDIETTMITLNKELQKQRADLYAEQNKDIINPSLEIQFQDTKKTLDNLQRGVEKLFNVSMYINCRSNYLNNLDIVSKKIESELNSSMIVPKNPIFRMAQAMKSVMPICFNELGIKRNITTGALSAFFPFTSQFLEIDSTGFWLGQNKNNVPIIKDVFMLTNPNGCILASSGSGKSYTAKLIVSRQLLNGTKVIVIDPQSEYAELSKRFNGQLISISRSSETIINPLDLMGHDYAEKRLALVDLFNIMLGGTSEIQKAVLDKALTRAYGSKGITKEPETWKMAPPIFGDLLAELEEMSKKATVIEKETYRSIINRLSMYVDGVFSFLNRQTKIDFSNKFVCFNIGDMPKQVKPVVMFIILDYVYMKMKKDKERKLLVIDEAWSLLRNQEEDSYIFEIVKTSRKFNLGLLLITQDVDDLLKSSAGLALLSNSSYTILLRQKPAVIDSAERVFRLSQTEKDILLTADKGEGIFICENEHSELKVIASKEEDAIITTNPDTLAEREREEKPVEVKEEKKETAPIPVDSEKCLFRKAGLNPEQINLLLDIGYIVSSHVPLGGGQREDYLLKFNEKEESAQHFFLVKAIEEYIRQFTGNVETFATRRPDIIFTANKTKWAFEIETGTLLKKSPYQFFGKVAMLKKEFGENWLFVVTLSDFVYTYSRYGKTYTRKNIQRKIRSIFKETLPLETRSKKPLISSGKKVYWKRAKNLNYRRKNKKRASRNFERKPAMNKIPYPKSKSAGKSR